MRRWHKRYLFAGIILLSLPGCEVDWRKCDSYQELLDLSVRRGLPGAVMLVETPDSLWIGTAGLADIGTEVSMQVTDRFRIASITKTFVTVVVLQLVEEGILSLDATIGEYLPEIADSIPHSSGITIRHLLNHTSGVYNYTDDNLLWHKALRDYSWQGGGPRELVKSAYFTGHKPYFEPGTGYHYSNTNYLLLELILESVTDSTLAWLLGSRILEPLAMESTFLEGTLGTPIDFVTGYDIEWGQHHDVKGMSFARGMGDGGFISNVFDIHTFIRALFSCSLFIKPSTLDTMLVLNPEADYCLGLMYRNDYGYDAWGHEGNWPGYLSVFYYWPGRDAILILIVNGSGLYLFKRIAKHALRLLFVPENCQQSISIVHLDIF